MGSALHSPEEVPSQDASDGTADICLQILLVYKGKGFCGGVIYKPTWVLTASHCMEDIDVQFLTVVAGIHFTVPPSIACNNLCLQTFYLFKKTPQTTFCIISCLSGEHNTELNEGTEQTVQVSEVIKHERYVPSTADNDIALLRLAEPISYTAYAIPACLPTRPLAQRELWAVSLHTVSGWGRRSENGPTSHILRQLKVPRIRTQKCKEDSGVQLTQNMFCAGYIEGQQDSCKGDSGGPLVTKYKKTVFLLGIVSWGKGCARPGHYGIYTRVSNYLEWIRNKTESFNQLTNNTDNVTTRGAKTD